MMIDLEIVRALANRESYTRYIKFVKREALSKEAYDILQWMGEWWKLNKAMTVLNYQSFAPFVLVSKLGGAKPEQLTIYKTWLTELNNPANEDAVSSVIQSLATRYHANAIAEKALAVVDGREDNLDSVEAQITALKHDLGKVDNEDSYLVSDDVMAILDEAQEAGLKWRLNCLNESLGDLRKGDLVVVATRPDTGKTTFLASESSYMAEKMPPELSVVWINNEEAGRKVKRRIVQSALGITSAQMFAKPEKVNEVWLQKMGRADKYVLYDKSDVSVHDVELLLDKHKAGLIIFDQLWKVHGFEKEAGGETQRQTMIFNWARELAKKHAPVITVHQADGSAEGVKWIDMSKLYGSKTGVQGEADAIITIGRLSEEGNKRYLYIPKNKLDGNNQAFRNGRYELEIQPEIARFKE
jgi:replicative DNA helicase